MNGYGSLGPHYFAPCPVCQTVTTHGGATDDHGCERGGQCQRCGHIEHPRPCAYAAPLTAVHKEFVHEH